MAFSKILKETKAKTQYYVEIFTFSAEKGNAVTLSIENPDKVKFYVYKFYVFLKV